MKLSSNSMRRWKASPARTTQAAATPNIHHRRLTGRDTLLEEPLRAELVHDARRDLLRHDRRVVNLVDVERLGRGFLDIGAPQEVTAERLPAPPARPPRTGRGPASRL